MPNSDTSARRLVLPLALAQFVASYAGTNMNVAISTIADDIGTTVTGMQTAITLFTLTMASLMIPGSKLTDIWGRKRCFLAGLAVYGCGAALAAVSQGMPTMIIGYSLLQGIGSALLIPPIYILITVAFADSGARAKYFGVVSGAAGLGAATGPLVGGLVTSTIGWRSSFLLQILIVAVVVVLAWDLPCPEPTGPPPRFDTVGAILSAAGLLLLVMGILQTGAYGWFVARKDFTIGGTVILAEGAISPVWLLVGAGALVLLGFFLHVRSRERRQLAPLVPLRLFRNRTANLGLGTQTIQWLVLQGSFFVISVFLQTKLGYNAIQTGLMLTPATGGILLASAAAERMAARHSPRWLIAAGFGCVAAGVVWLLAFGREGTILGMAPALFLMGTGIGVMLTASVNVVQSSFPAADQGEISGLSRSASNLGSSIGTALVGSVIAGASERAGHPIALALLTMLLITLAGVALALLLPRQTGNVEARSTQRV